MALHNSLHVRICSFSFDALYQFQLLNELIRDDKKVDSCSKTTGELNIIKVQYAS
jgi:hypothetical protein